MLKSAKTLNVCEVAEYIGVSRRTLYRMIDDQRFTVKPIKGTKPARWNIAALDIWRVRQ